MEKSAGVYKAFQVDPDVRRGGRPWESKDFHLLRSELASVKNDLSYQKYKCTRFLDHLAFLDELAGRKEGLAEYWIKVRFMKSTIVGYEERAVYLSDRVETTMQTCFSLMVEKDNHLNQRTASQSLELTNLSRKDNEHMKKIATATFRHSRDMRSITITTLSFLPATTFVATFFSTSFFDFKEDRRRASTWLWLYWVVAVVLTGAVLGGWHYFSHGVLEHPGEELDVVDQRGAQKEEPSV
ncbi:hypothetical protein BDV95DRAFT_605462 [Massariosphaeria phaeospora]|uniref:Uncharacterized protein n=1 Tax=Massariosphaeria phaeospora TaxID=100035 RepID=A0A7C8IBB9_9PLEO|nr:hypothetical protein BDV95DRAFT_605462 [Massariosphaeria phaeospora]